MSTAPVNLFHIAMMHSCSSSVGRCCSTRQHYYRRVLSKERIVRRDTNMTHGTPDPPTPGPTLALLPCPSTQCTLNALSTRQPRTSAGHLSSDRGVATNDVSKNSPPKISRQGRGGKSTRFCGSSPGEIPRCDPPRLNHGRRGDEKALGRYPQG